jgi:hypothetical protein
VTCIISHPKSPQPLRTVIVRLNIPAVRDVNIKYVPLFSTNPFHINGLEDVPEPADVLNTPVEAFCNKAEGEGVVVGAIVVVVVGTAVVVVGTTVVVVGATVVVGTTVVVVGTTVVVVGATVVVGTTVVVVVGVTVVVVGATVVVVVGATVVVVGATVVVVVGATVVVVGATVVVENGPLVVVDNPVQSVKAWSLSNMVMGNPILSILLVIISSELLFKDDKLLNIVVGL